MLTDTQRLLGHRMVAQLLAPAAAAPCPDTTAGVAGHMVAVQAQLYASGVEALELRGAPDVLAAIDRGEVVRSWTQRGTHHFVAAADERWLGMLCTPRPHAAAARRREAIGLDDAMVDRARELLWEALAGQGPVTRAEICEMWRAAGIDPDQGRGSHLLRFFGEEPEIVQGPRSGANDTFVWHDDWIPNSRNLIGDEALAELARRFVEARGPVLAADLAFWSGLTVTEARRGLGMVTQELAVAEFAGVEYLMAPWQVDITEVELTAALEPVRRLPAFDEWLLGYRDRSATLPAELVAEVGPTKNGMVHPFVVSKGIVTGRQQS